MADATTLEDRRALGFGSEYARQRGFALVAKANGFDDHMRDLGDAVINLESFRERPGTIDLEAARHYARETALIAMKLVGVLEAIDG